MNSETTDLEHVACDFRRWQLLPANWDGEGASQANPRSIGGAIAFLNLLTATSDMPSPMLHSSGRAGLFFKTAELYADLEFLEDGRMAYYIERNGDKHKGVLDISTADQLPSRVNK